MESLSLLTELNQRGQSCTGCGACDNICPVRAISMHEDECGFLYPFIDTEICINCGQCVHTCQMRGKSAVGLKPETCYAIQSTDDMRRKSSSGGAFGTFAEYMIRQGGYVVGASMEDDLHVRHICVSDMDDLEKLQKSKYVQSETGDIYRQVSDLLKTGKPVLFSGTPCQVSGLYAYLGGRPDGLVTVDLLCHGVPSRKMLRESMDDVFGEAVAVSADFRDKDYGWESLGVTVKLKDGTKRRLSYDESRYEQGFHTNMTLRESCYDCEFCDFPRQGDLSVGDFWNIETYDSSWNDGLGTSAVIVNTDHGCHFFEAASACFQRCEAFPIDCLAQNRIYGKTDENPGRAYFMNLWKNHGFNRSVYLAQQGKYDIGIVGNWSYPNYGTALTYYSLHKKLKSMGHAVGMVSWPESSDWKPYDQPELFCRNPYESYEVLPIPETRADLFALGERCDIFLLGSDQLLNNNLYRWFDKFIQMDWVPSHKRKIAYAASFGCDYTWGEQWDHAEMAHFLQQFDRFSVREESGTALLKQQYGLDAEQVMDPVFFLEEKDFDDLEKAAERSTPNEPYLFAYILDADQEKECVLDRCSDVLGLKLYIAHDAAPEEHAVTLSRNVSALHGLKLEEWISFIRNAAFVVTDSFHGMCTAIILRKPFVAVANRARGATRFEDILRRLGLESRLINAVPELKNRPELITEPIDFDSVTKKLKLAVAEGTAWLKEALTAQLPVKSLTDYDILSRRLIDHRRHMDHVDRLQWEQLEDHRLRMDGADDRLNRHETAVMELAQTDHAQWEQLEDHRLRMDGVDDRLNRHETAARELEQTDKVQWEQLEDHRLRMDGADDRLNRHETVVRELEQTNRLQWEQLEEHRLRMDGVDSHLDAYSAEMEIRKRQLRDLQLELDAMRSQLEVQQNKQKQLQSELELLSKYSLLYRIFKFFAFLGKGN